MVPADSDRIPRVPPYSGYCYLTLSLPVRGCHPLWPTFPGSSCSLCVRMSQSYNPDFAVTKPVWATSVSLATTPEITFVFFSSCYLDVSVHRVCPSITRGVASPMQRVAPFGYPRIKSYLQIPAAFRSLSRPSSPPRAQASPVRPSLLSLSAYNTLLLCYTPLLSSLNHVNELVALKKPDNRGE